MNIAFITNKPYYQSETFIKAQIDKLPFRIVHYWGHKIPLNIKMDQVNIFMKVVHYIGIIKRKTKLSIFCNDLELNEVDVVLAHYGIMGEEVLEACQNLKIVK